MESDYLAALGPNYSGGALDQLIFSLGHSRALADDWPGEGWRLAFLICVSDPWNFPAGRTTF